MDDDKRKYFRISPKNAQVELPGFDIELLDISIGGAKFKLKGPGKLEKNILVLYLDEHDSIDIPFHEVETQNDTWRVTFLPITPILEAAIARFIMNWQLKRALRSDDE